VRQVHLGVKNRPMALKREKNRVSREESDSAKGNLRRHAGSKRSRHAERTSTSCRWELIEKVGRRLSRDGGRGRASEGMRRSSTMLDSKFRSGEKGKSEGQRPKKREKGNDFKGRVRTAGIRVRDLILLRNPEGGRPVTKKAKGVKVPARGLRTAW